MAENVPAYAGMDYRSLAQVEKQWPDVAAEIFITAATSMTTSRAWASSGPLRPRAKRRRRSRFPTARGPRGAEGLQVMQAVPALYAPGTLVDRSPHPPEPRRRDRTCGCIRRDAAHAGPWPMERRSPCAVNGQASDGRGPGERGRRPGRWPCGRWRLGSMPADPNPDWRKPKEVV